MGIAAELGKAIAGAFGDRLNSGIHDLWMATMPAVAVYRGLIKQVWRRFMAEFFRQ
jgi:hypothetical protein